MQPDGPITLLAFAGLNASLVRTKRCRYLTAPAHFSKAHNHGQCAITAFALQAKLQTDALLPKGAASRFQCWNASMQYPAETARFWLSPSLPGLEAAFPCKLTSVSPARAALPQRQQKRCLGCAKVPKFALAALVVQHRFRRPAARISRQAKAKEQQLLPLPSHLPRLEAAFPTSLHRLDRHGWLCPEGSKSAAWSEPRFPNLPCGTGCAAQVQKV